VIESLSGSFLIGKLFRRGQVVHYFRHFVGMNFAPPGHRATVRRA
jgi:hypothetical protein